MRMYADDCSDYFSGAKVTGFKVGDWVRDGSKTRRMKVVRVFTPPSGEVTLECRYPSAFGNGDAVCILVARYAVHADVNAPGGAC